MSRDPIDNADQPPEVDVNDPTKTLPPAAAAAERVRDFISSFGDGEIFPADETGPALYARDLEAIARCALGINP